MESFTNYIINQGNFTHILTFFINDKLSESEKSLILTKLYNKINNKPIEKNILGFDFPLIWRVANEKNLFHYYSNGCGGIMSDLAINIHTQLLVDDLHASIGYDKFTYIVTKLLTMPISIR
jgi:hypothetical protein